MSIKTFLLSALTLLILPVFVGIFVYWYNTPKPKLSVLYAYTATTPYHADALGQLHLEYKESQKLNRFDLRVESVGSESIKNLEIDLVSFKKKLFSHHPVIIFEPAMIEKRQVKREISAEHIYLSLSELPSETSVSLRTDTDQNYGDNDVDIAVIGSGRRWEAVKQDIILEKKKPSFFKNILGYDSQVSHAFAAESAPAQKEKEHDRNHGSGVSLGGYDPVRLTNEIFLLLQKKGVMNRVEAENVKKKVEEAQGGVAIGGVNVLKADEETMNLLLQKGLITMPQANVMLERSRNAGGVLINGFNVIHLKAEILNALIHKNLISVQEAQSALDSAKVPK
jgi:hypothetical protein